MSPFILLISQVWWFVAGVVVSYELQPIEVLKTFLRFLTKMNREPALRRTKRITLRGGRGTPLRINNIMGHAPKRHAPDQPVWDMSFRGMP